MVDKSVGVVVAIVGLASLAVIISFPKKSNKAGVLNSLLSGLS